MFDVLLVGLALVPSVMLAAHWTGGTTGMTILAVGVPVVLLLLRLANPMLGQPVPAGDSATGLMLRDRFEGAVANIYAETEARGLHSACFLIELDDADDLRTRHGEAAHDLLLQRMADRIVGTLRAGDRVARLSDARFAVCLDPVLHLDLETSIQIAGRLQSIVEEAVHIDGLTVFASCSIGFCLRSRAPSDGHDRWLQASRLALMEARTNGPSAIRAYTQDMHNRHLAGTALVREVSRALDQGEFQTWFQPQLDTDTGRVAGFEALARWHHPTRGTLPPDQFLPFLETQGLLPRLTETILKQTVQALANWDLSAEQVPMVSINLSQQDLSNPHLTDTILWALERFDLTASRLCFEVLETVVSDTPDDVTVRTLQRLHKLGCGIDLDDFGTGQASLAAIRRFPINRIKIDRSFVMKCDQDLGQQRLVTAILSMAEQLQLETLAEGVETVGEHALLAQLGCGYVQGFGIARPMPFEDTGAWLQQHGAKLAQPAQIQRRSG